MDMTGQASWYKDRVNVEAREQWARRQKQQATEWRECRRCKRNTRHVDGRCVDCNDPDYRELSY